MQSNTFRTFLRTACAACAMLPTLARGQSETLAISGTFQMDAAYGGIGADLAEVYARGGDHTWTLTLYGVTFENDSTYEEWGDLQVDGGYVVQYISRAHATSFTLEFFGPDAATLNNVVSGPLVSGGLTDGAVAMLVNGDYFDPYYREQSGPYTSFSVGLNPSDYDDGVKFSCYAVQYSSYTPAYPSFEPRRITGVVGWIEDDRFPNWGDIQTVGQTVDIGSSVPPQPDHRLSILDGSVVEGNKGTTRLDLSVRLSGASSEPVTVQYRTMDGSATARNDYTATSGTLTFQPGDTRLTISISIKADRKREPHETFAVQLSNAVGATISDGIATVTILNDD